MVLVYNPSVEVRESWDQQARLETARFLEDLEQIDLFSEVEHPWKNAGKRLEQVKFKEALTRIEKRQNFELRWSSNPGLANLKHQSKMLNLREQNFSLGDAVEVCTKKVKAAFSKMLMETGLAATEKQIKEVDWYLFDVMRRLVWERLNADAIQEPFYELEFEILLAGHLPCGVEGKDWKTCKILYC